MPILALVDSDTGAGIRLLGTLHGWGPRPPAAGSRQWIEEFASVYIELFAAGLLYSTGPYVLDAEVFAMASQGLATLESGEVDAHTIDVLGTGLYRFLLAFKRKRGSSFEVTASVEELASEDMKKVRFHVSEAGVRDFGEKLGSFGRSTEDT